MARRVAAEGDALVAGNLSNTWAYDPADHASHARTRALLERQVALQMEEGVDFFIGETYTFLGEALIALEVARASGLPVMITMAFKSDPHSFEGDDAAECARRVMAPVTIHQVIVGKMALMQRAGSHGAGRPGPG